MLQLFEILIQSKQFKLILSFKVINSLAKLPKNERTCKTCKIDSDQIIQISKLCKWNYNSKFALNWLTKLDLPSLDTISQDYQNKVSSLNFQSKQTYDMLEAFQSQFDQFYNNTDRSINFSLLEWFYQILKNVNKDTVFDNLSQVLSLLQLHDQINYDRQTFFLALFFLTVSQDYVAYNLLKTLYESILPIHYNPSYIKQNDVQSILDIEINKSVGEFQSYFKIPSQDLVPLKQAISQLLIQFEPCLFLQGINFSLSFKIIDDLFTYNDVDILRKYFLSILKSNLAIIKKEPNKKILMQKILQVTQLQDINEIMKQIKQQDDSHYLGQQQQQPPQLELPEKVQRKNCKQYKFLKDHKEHKDSKLWKIHQNLSNMSYIIYSSKSPKLNISDVQEEEDEVQLTEQTDLDNLQNEDIQQNQEEIQRLREEIQKQDEEIRRVQSENQKLAKMNKHKKLEILNYAKDSQNQFEEMDYCQQNCFDGLLNQIEDGIMMMQKIQSQLISKSGNYR